MIVAKGGGGNKGWWEGVCIEGGNVFFVGAGLA
jgi:hypothetical protein